MPSLALTVFLMLSATAVSAADPSAPISFRSDVAPILVKKCLSCHNDKKASGGLKLTTFANLRKGGASAGVEILVPGDPAASGLIESIAPGAEPRMPFKLPPLRDYEIRTLTAWVTQGANFDGGSETSTNIASLVDPLKHLPKIAQSATKADPVTALAFSHDGKTIAAASGRKVFLFDTVTGNLKATLADHPGPLSGILLTPDGKQLIAAGGRAGMFGALTLWDVDLAKPIVQARGHADTILAAALAPDGKTLATASYDRLVLLWDLASLKPVATLKDHTDAVYALAFAPDGKSLASAGADRTVKLWDLASRKRGKTLSDATGELYALTYSPDGTTLFAAGVDRSIRAWRVAEKEVSLLRSAFAHDAPVIRLIASHDGKSLVSSGEDRDVKVWDLATLSARIALPEQPDWPQSIALTSDTKTLAVGRYDGTIALYDFVSGKAIRTLSVTPLAVAAAPKKPALFRNASLAPPSPRGGTRGTKVRISLSGNGVGLATEVVFDEPTLRGTIVANPKPDSNRIEVDLTIAMDARVGIHRLGVITPLGVPAFQTFAVESDPPVNESEPNDDPKTLKPITLPATLVGTIDKPGDRDGFRFAAKAGQQYVFNSTQQSLGSSLQAFLSVFDENGNKVAEAAPDDVLTVMFSRDGDYTLVVTDYDSGGSGNHFYRIAASPSAYLSDVFPVGIERGKTVSIKVAGANLDGRDTVTVTAGATAELGSLLDVPFTRRDGSRSVNRRVIVVADGPQDVENEPNDNPMNAAALPVPGGVSGRISSGDDIDHFKFQARHDQPLILEVYGRRLGTAIDPFLEVLDSRGNPVPRAVLHALDETEVAFRDHNASGTGIRLTRWNNLAMNDIVMIGREVTRIFALPRNPDDDCQFWSEQGQRVGLFETTPEHHPMAQKIYKVEVHPPGTTFPPGGVLPVTLEYKNDDGGPSFNKDARITFHPPADGTYIVRVRDARALGGDAFAYHLVVRAPKPDFRVTISQENPNINRGGTSLVALSATRIDGYDGPIDVNADHLPPGITATPTRIDRGMTTALLALSADASAPAFSPPTWSLTAQATVGDEHMPTDSSIRHDIDPGGKNGGWITVVPSPNLKIVATPERIQIKPGQQVTMNLAVERANGFAGRVPIEIRNLPHGVRVLNIGLNGVLVTEKQTERTVFLYAEPWVETMERPFYAVGKAEAAGTEHSSAPNMLVVLPAQPGSRAATTGLKVGLGTR